MLNPTRQQEIHRALAILTKAADDFNFPAIGVCFDEHGKLSGLIIGKTQVVESMADSPEVIDFEFFDRDPPNAQDEITLPS